MWGEGADSGPSLTLKTQLLYKTIELYEQFFYSKFEGGGACKTLQIIIKALQHIWKLSLKIWKRVS